MPWNWTVQRSSPTASSICRLNSASRPEVRWADAVTGFSDWGISPLAGTPGTTVELEITTPGGEHRSVRLQRSLHTDMMAGRAPSSIQMLSDIPSQGRFHFSWLDNDVAYIWLGSFESDEIVAEFEDHLEELRENARGMVLDLRGNGGGSTTIGSAILRHLTDRPLEGSRWQSRKTVSVYRAWGALDRENFDAHHREHALGTAWETGQHPTVQPAERPIIVPTVILTGRRTASAAEDFLVYADAAPHMFRFGEATQGSTGQSLWIDLPGGGGARMVVKRDQFPDGRDFVGVGILPHQAIMPTLEDILAGRDLVLKTAVRHLSER